MLITIHSPLPKIFGVVYTLEFKILRRWYSTYTVYYMYFITLDHQKV